MHLFDPLARFQPGSQDAQLFELFRAGATLHHDGEQRQWWLHLADGSDTPAAPDYQGVFWSLKSVGEEAPAAAESEHKRRRTWRFAEREFVAQQTIWRRAQECAADWNAKAGKFEGSLLGLSGAALKLVKAGKAGKGRNIRIDMRAEDIDALMELNAAGVLNVDPRGWAQVTVHKRQLPTLLRAARMHVQATSRPHIFMSPGPEEKTFDPMDGLDTPEGLKVLELFRNGAQLNIWRWSSPHNHWLAKRGKEVYMWSNERDAGTREAVPRPGTLLPIGRRILAEGIIPPCRFGTHRDGGQYGKEVWEFDERAFEGAKVRWASAQRAAGAWKAAAGPFTGNLAGLSDQAMAALRALKSRKYWNLPVRFELFPLLAELNAAGFVEVQPQGWASPRLDLQTLKLPKGPFLELVELTEGNEHPMHGEPVGRVKPHWHELRVPGAPA